MKAQTEALIHDDEYLPVLMTLLENAKSQVDILAFSFAFGSGARSESNAASQIVKKLLQLKAKNRKLKIRLYLEGERETSERNRITANYLSKGGVEVRFGATHAKGICIDGKIVLFGSTNLTNQSMTKNIETNLLLSTPAAVKGFKLYFAHLWDGGHHGGIHLPPPFLADGAFKDVLIEMIDSAKRRLDFSIYFFDHREIEQALIRASQRKVKVTGFLHSHKSFALSFVRRTLATAKRLEASGITHLFLGPPSLFTHSKFLVLDQRELLLGTGNWLLQDVNIHPQLYIRLANAKLAKALTSELARKIKKRGTPLFNSPRL